MLEANDSFWEAVGRLPTEPDPTPYNGNFEEFLRDEVQALRHIFDTGDMAQIDEILSEVDTLKRAINSQQITVAQAERLRRRVARFGALICNVQVNTSEQRSFAYRLVKKGLVIAAGVSVIVGDGLLVLGNVAFAPVAKYSGGVGVALIVSQLPDD